MCIHHVQRKHTPKNENVAYHALLMHAFSGARAAVCAELQHASASGRTPVSAWLHPAHTRITSLEAVTVVLHWCITSCTTIIIYNLSMTRADLGTSSFCCWAASSLTISSTFLSSRLAMHVCRASTCFCRPSAYALIVSRSVSIFTAVAP